MDPLQLYSPPDTTCDDPSFNLNNYPVMASTTSTTDLFYGQESLNITDFLGSDTPVSNWEASPIPLPPRLPVEPSALVNFELTLDFEPAPTLVPNNNADPPEITLGTLSLSDADPIMADLSSPEPASVSNGGSSASTGNSRRPVKPRVKKATERTKRTEKRPRAKPKTKSPSPSPIAVQKGPHNTWRFAKDQRGVRSTIEKQLNENNFLLVRCTNPDCKHWTIAFPRRPKKLGPRKERDLPLPGGAQLLLKGPFDPTGWQRDQFEWIYGFQCTTDKYSPVVAFTCFSCNNPASSLEVYWPQGLEVRAGSIRRVDGYTPIPNEWGAGFISEQCQPFGGRCYHMCFPST